MKRILIALCVALASVGAYAQQGVTAIGVNGSYASEFKNIGIGAEVQYGVTDAIRVEAGFDYFLKKDGVSMWDINLNAHYLIPVVENLKVYPLVGLTYTNWKSDDGGSGDYDDEDYGDYEDYYDYARANADDYEDYEDDGDDDSLSRIGANLGVGIQYDITSNWAVNFEAKYQLIKDVDQFVLGLGVVYKF